MTFLFLLSSSSFVSTLGDVRGKVFFCLTTKKSMVRKLFIHITSLYIMAANSIVMFKPIIQHERIVLLCRIIICQNIKQLIIYIKTVLRYQTLYRPELWARISCINSYIKTRDRGQNYHRSTPYTSAILWIKLPRNNSTSSRKRSGVRPCITNAHHGGR